MPGVFAAGDVRHGSVKRVASAVGEGSATIQQIHGFVASRRLFASDRQGSTVASSRSAPAVA